MKLLKVINPENADEKNTTGWKQRRAARAVVFDAEGKIGLLCVKKENYYKLPGGGVEEGEGIRTALDRECQEELGVRIQITQEVGSIVEFRSQYKLHQTSECFLGHVVSEKMPQRFDDYERKQGFEAVWVTPAEALKLLNLKQTTDYEGKFIEERDFCFLSEALEPETTRV